MHFPFFSSAYTSGISYLRTILRSRVQVQSSSGFSIILLCLTFGVTLSFCLITEDKLQRIDKVDKNNNAPIILVMFAA